MTTDREPRPCDDCLEEGVVTTEHVQSFEVDGETWHLCPDCLQAAADCSDLPEVGSDA